MRTANSDTIKCFCCDLNWSRFDEPSAVVLPSAPQDWAFVDPAEYFEWHREFGSNAAFCQAYAFTGYAFYPTKLGPVAPGPGAELLPRLYDLAKRADMPFWSYFCVGADLFVSETRPTWIVPGTRCEERGSGYLGPETPWTDLLCARIAEFLTAFPVDWILFDWFVYGSLHSDTFAVRPGRFVRKPFEEIVGRPMPEAADQITPDESLRYKRGVLARQFRRIRDAVKGASPMTRIIFNVPFWHADEAIWRGHPMLAESDGLFAECSREEVVEWLLKIRSPAQRVMTTIVGRTEDGECSPANGLKWHARGCDLFGYAWGTPPDFHPHPAYLPGVEATRKVFRQIG